MWRSRRTPGPSPFQEMDAAKAAAAAAAPHRPIIDLSIGTPDLPPPPEALQALKAAVDDPATHKYCLKSHTLPLLGAACDWFRRTYGVSFDPASEALVLVGSQEGLAHLLLAVADPGDGLLLMDVAYPSYLGAVHVAGLRPVFVPTDPDTLLPDFAAVPRGALASCRALLLNFPNNPTSATVDDAFWRDTLAWAEEHDLLLIHDNPYVCQDYALHASPSPLALPGARARCVELFSLSKSFNMGGFRLGFALGNADAIAALAAVKAPIDFAQYLGIQRMGLACLALPPERSRAYATEFQRRAEALTGALRAMGWDARPPKACMYLWVRLPPGIDDLAFAKRLVQETGVAVSPGRGFGPGGYGYVRFALVQSAEVLVECARRISIFLRDHADEVRAQTAPASSELAPAAPRPAPAPVPSLCGAAADAAAAPSVRATAFVRVLPPTGAPAAPASKTAATTGMRLCAGNGDPRPLTSPLTVG